MKKRHLLSFCGRVILSALALSPIRSMACGLDWKVPRGHFDGVDEKGTVSYWEKISDLDLGKGIKIPLIMGFESSSNLSSPYLGEGWTLALLDSNIVQIDDKRFIMVQPDGWTSRFGRKETTDTILSGEKGWMASINGNQITVWAKCGWKLLYTDGKITSIETPQNQVLSYVYEGGIVKEIDEDGVPILKVAIDPTTGIVSGLAFSDGKNISIAEGQKPHIENINGQNVVGEVKPSLQKLTLANGSVESFKFAVTPKLLPTLNISEANNNRSFSWEPATKLILQDGDWSYKIVPAKEQFSNAQITRVNGTGQSEYWYYDHHDGQEITQSLNGVKRIKEFFTTGILKGKVRKIEQVTSAGQTTLLYAASYDESGNLIRVVQGNYLATIDKSDNTFEIRDLASGKPIWRTQRTNDGSVDILSGLNKIP